MGCARCTRLGGGSCVPAEVVEATLERPRDLGDAIARLADDPDLQALGGGTAVVPALSARDGIGSPTERRWLAVDSLAELLAPIRLDDGWLTFGAATTLRSLELEPLVLRHAPLLAAATGSVAGPAIRNQATIGGSLALGLWSPDPATAMVALDGRIVVGRTDGIAEIRPEERRPRDLIIGVRIPVASSDPQGVAWAYRRHTMRGAADRPIVTVAVMADVAGSAGDVRIAIGAATAAVVRLTATEAAVVQGDDAMTAAAAELEGLAIRTDDRASAGYRRRVAAVLVGRAVAAATAARAVAAATAGRRS